MSLTIQHKVEHSTIKIECLSIQFEHSTIKIEYHSTILYMECFNHYHSLVSSARLLAWTLRYSKSGTAIAVSAPRRPAPTPPPARRRSASRDIPLGSYIEAFVC